MNDEKEVERLANEIVELFKSAWHPATMRIYVANVLTSRGKAMFEKGVIQEKQNAIARLNAIHITRLKMLQDRLGNSWDKRTTEEIHKTLSGFHGSTYEQAIALVAFLEGRK